MPRPVCQMSLSSFLCTISSSKSSVRRWTKCCLRRRKSSTLVWSQKVEKIKRDCAHREMEGDFGKVIHVLSTSTCLRNMAKNFSDYFTTKIPTICQMICSKLQLTRWGLSQPVRVNPWQFAEATEEEVHKLVTKSPSKSCDLDPRPTWLLKKRSSQLVPFLTSTINKSLASVTVLSSFKHASVRPLLKKGLDKEVLGPIPRHFLS